MEPKRGRKPTWNKELVKQAVLKYKDVVLLEDFRIVSKTHEIWRVIFKEINSAGKMESVSKSLYSFVCNDTDGIRTELKHLREVNSSVLTDSICMDESRISISPDDTVDNSDNDDDGDHISEFSFIMNKSEFDKLVIEAPRRRKYGNKITYYSKQILKPGVWESVITEKIWLATRKKHGFNYKNHHVSNNGQSGTINGM